MNRLRIKLVGSILLLFHCGICPLSGQSENDRPEIDVLSQWAARAPYKNGSMAAVEEQRVSFDISSPLAGNDDTGLGLDTAGESRWYDFGKFSGIFLPAKNPLNEAHLLSSQISAQFAVAGGYRLFSTGALEYSAARQADFNRSFHCSTSFGAYVNNWMGNSKLGLGVAVERRLSGSVFIVPFPVLDWVINREWEVVSLDGDKGRLNYRVNKNLSLFGEVDFESDDIRLGPQSSFPRGIMREEAFPTWIGCEIRVFRKFHLLGRAGMSLRENFSFFNEAGVKIVDSRVRTPALVGLEIDYIL